MDDFIRSENRKTKEELLWRSLSPLEEANAREIRLEGRSYLNFSSNDYLGLSTHPKVIAAARTALDRYGAGGRASRLITGTLDLHRELEMRLARWKGTESALLFPTGFMANLGVIASLLGSGDAVILDRLNHASLIDSAKLSRARIFIYEHASAESLEKVLKRTRSYAKRLVVTDTLFSMDGDFAPLPEISQICRRENVWLMVDDAHALGVFGHSGSGLPEHFGLQKEIPIQVGTCSKALGAQGGFVCGSKELIDFLINRARPFIYTTALNPAACAAALAALDLIEAEPQKRKDLLSLSRRFAAKLQSAGHVSGGVSQIVPFQVGAAEEALRWSQDLKDAGFYAPAIRPPTVPKNECRLRFSLTSAHREADVDKLLSVLLSSKISA